MNSVSLFSMLLLTLVVSACSTKEPQKSKEKEPMEISNKQKAIAFVESFENGDTTALNYLSDEQYIQHNLGAADGKESFIEFIDMAPKGSIKAKVIRAFQDGDHVFLHTKYDFFGPKAGFEIFRFEDGKIVEHWDNLATITPPNPSGRTQLDGPTEVTDLDKTEENKALVKAFVTAVLKNGQVEKIADFIHPEKYHQHNPQIADGLEGLTQAFAAFQQQGITVQYDTIHMVLGEGNFVLVVSEGVLGPDTSAFYDLFRVEQGKIVEHWDIIEPIPPRETWKNENGKF